jgi:hypothetical protein
MDEAPHPVEEPANLRFLRRLVTALAGVMILGLLTIIALFVIRFWPPRDAALPDRITLPDGARAEAFTQGGDWYAIVTDDDRILIYDRAGGQLRQTVVIER